MKLFVDITEYHHSFPHLGKKRAIPSLYNWFFTGDNPHIFGEGGGSHERFYARKNGS
jgi:hypothetical protein